MCRHCERIVEHPEDRPIVHAFVDLAAKRLNERRSGDGPALTANDLTVTIDVTVQNLSQPLLPLDSAARGSVYRMLQEIGKEGI